MHVPSAADIIRAAEVACESEDVHGLGEVARVDCSLAHKALAALKESGFDQLVEVFGVDTGEAIEYLTYHVRVLAEVRDGYLRCAVPYDGDVESVWELYPAALYPERETAELLGMAFSGHPNPKRLLTTEGTEPLLRKSVPIRTAEEVWYS